MGYQSPSSLEGNPAPCPSEPQELNIHPASPYSFVKARYLYEMTEQHAHSVTGLSGKV